MTLKEFVSPQNEVNTKSEGVGTYERRKMTLDDAINKAYDKSDREYGCGHFVDYEDVVKLIKEIYADFEKVK